MTFTATITHGATIAALLAFAAGQVCAELADQPTGPVVLTVSGAIAHTNQEDKALFDLEMLRKLETHEVVTSTIWTEGVHSFRGVSLGVLLEHLGAHGTAIEARALNDYAVEIPLSEIADGAPLIAFEMDGSVMSRREKGPLWVIYPFDDGPQYRSEVIFSRSIWQLDRIAVLE